LWPVACVMGNPSKLPSVVLTGSASCCSIQDSVTDVGEQARKKYRPEKIRPVPIVVT
jgi:hypothetical protein